MNKKILSVMVVCALTACAGNSAFIRQSPIVDDKGAKSYLLSNEISVYDESSPSLLKAYDERANQLCPSGYTLVNQETRKITNAFGMYVGGKEITWQVKCKTSDQPKT